MSKKGAKKVKRILNISNKLNKKTPKKDSKVRLSNNNTNFDTINKKLDKILSNQKLLLKEEKLIEKKEGEIEKEEKLMESLEEEELLEETKLRNIDSKETAEIKHFEEKEEKKFEEIKNIEAEIKKDVGQRSLTKITRNDIFKAITGAFAGLVIHFSFNYVFELSKNITFARASFFYLMSFIICITIIYAAGFRKVTEKKHLIFLPLRAIIIYITALIVTLLILFLFSPNFGLNFKEAYIQTSIAMITAIIGATTADLIGKG